MFAAAARKTARTATQTRAISSLVNKPSKVAADQKLFTSSHKPTYLKRDSDKAVFGALLGAWAFGMLQFLRGEVNMGTGRGKAE